jgi:Protein of unknown function (DUF3572)
MVENHDHAGQPHQETGIMQQESAQTVALQALGWLAGDEDLFLAFLAATGADAADLRVRAAEVEFQVAILDFLLMNDAYVIGFCDAAGIAYTTPMTALVSLQGGEAMNWT